MHLEYRFRFRWVGFRKFASLGYAVLMVDGRGSSNRGISFEAALKNKLVSGQNWYTYIS